MVGVFRTALFCSLIAITVLLHGQTSDTATFTGIITDPDGALVIGAKVSARNLATGLAQVRTTGSAGNYTISALPPGEYELSCEATGFAKVVRPRVRVSVGQAARLDFRMPLNPLKYTVTVSERSPVLDGQSTNSQVLHENEVNAIPVFTRNFVQLTLLTPKVLPASSTDSRGYMGDRYRENQFSFQGVHHQYNYQTIDGASATVFMTNTLKSFYSLESVQEFRVSNSLYTSEQGHAMGGLVNVITRSGTNAWHGNVYNYFRNDAMNKPDMLALQDFDVLRRNEFGASVGGPLRKDRLYVFGNYEGQRQANTPQLSPVFVKNLAGINQALSQLGFPPETDHVLQTADYDQFLIRTDFVPGAKHRLMFRYNFFNATNLNDRIGSHGQLDDPILPLGARDQHLRDQGTSVNFTSFPSSNWVNEAGFGFEKHVNEFEPKAGVPPIELAVRGAFSTGQNFTELATDDRKFHVHDTVSWSRGSHILKFGAEYIRADASHASVPFSAAFISGLQALLITPPLVGRTSIISGTIPRQYIFHANQTGTFIQDQWKATRQLTLTLGLRYDLELIGGLTTLVDSGRGNLQPRVGFAWSVNDVPIVVRGGFGTYVADRYHPTMALDALFHGTSFPNFSPAFLDANPFARDFQPLPDVNRTEVFTGPAALPALLQFASDGTAPVAQPSQGFISVQRPDLPNPYARQWGFEVEYQVRPDLTVIAGYSGLQGRRLPVNINLNLRPATAQLPSGKNDYQGVGLDAIAHLYDRAFAAVYVAEPAGSSLYNAGTLTVRKRFAQHYSFTANYVFSRNLDDYGALSITAVPEDVYNIGRDWSLSSEHAKHRLVLWLNAEAPARVPLLGGVAASTIVSLQSPRYYNVTVGTDVNHDFNANTDRPDAIGRNTFRGDSFATVDVRVSRAFRSNERVKLEAIADLFNLFNRVNVTDFDTVYGQPTLALPPAANFGLPRAVANGFQTQLGIRISF